MQYFDPKQYGKNIKELRELRKMTQEELAKELGYSDARQLQRIEAGTSAGKIDTLVEISQTLEVSTDHLLYGTKEGVVDKRIVEFLEGKTPDEQEFVYRMLQSIFNNKNLLVS